MSHMPHVLFIKVLIKVFVDTNPESQQPSCGFKIKGCPPFVDSAVVCAASEFLTRPRRLRLAVFCSADGRFDVPMVTFSVPRRPI